MRTRFIVLWLCIVLLLAIVLFFDVNRVWLLLFVIAGCTLAHGSIHGKHRMEGTHGK